MLRRLHPALLDSCHRLLGPRPVYFIGSTRRDGTPHLCAATNVTAISSSPTLVTVALWPEWETRDNILRHRRLSISLATSDQVPAVMVAGHRYTGRPLPPQSDKFSAAGLTPLLTEPDYPAGVADCIAVLLCDVLKVLDDLGDHDVLVTRVRSAWADSTCFSQDLVLDVNRRNPLLQITGQRFAAAQPTT